jgi:thioester reductase-like protein
MAQRSKVLVTGAGGFIGHYLVSADFLSQGMFL